MVVCFSSSWVTCGSKRRHSGSLQTDMFPIWYEKQVIHLKYYLYLMGTVASQLRNTNSVREIQSDIPITLLQEKPNWISPETCSSAIRATNRAFLTYLPMLSVQHRGCLLRNAQVMLTELSSLQLWILYSSTSQ